MKIIKTLLNIVFFGFSSLALAQAEPMDRPSWMTDAVIKGIMGMNLTESQRGPFREHLSECLSGIQADVHKVTKRGGFDLKKKIERANKYRWRDFESKMQQLLSEEQIPAFDRYLKIQRETVRIVLSSPDSERIRWN